MRIGWRGGRTGIARRPAGGRVSAPGRRQQHGLPARAAGEGSSVSAHLCSDLAVLCAGRGGAAGGAGSHARGWRGSAQGSLRGQQDAEYSHGKTPAVRPAARRSARGQCRNGYKHGLAWAVAGWGCCGGQPARVRSMAAIWGARRERPPAQRLSKNISDSRASGRRGSLLTSAQTTHGGGGGRARSSR